MNYSTKKKFVNVFCYSDDKIKKTEATAFLKNWCKEKSVTNFSAEKTLDVEEGKGIKIIVDDYIPATLTYKEKEETFFGFGYSNDPIGNEIGNGIRCYEEGKFLVLCYAVKKQEGEIRIE